MERLTYRGENGKPYVKADGYYQHCRMNLDSVADRLAAYEETGLTPEGVAALQTHPDHAYADYVKALWADIGGMDKMEELARAEEAGLLVRLPCKVGDTVFRIWHGEIERYQVVSVWFNDHIKRSFHAECFPFLRFYDEDIGKRVFLTIEEAEAAFAKDTNVPAKEG